MPRDDDSLIDLEELASVLRAHEGPPEAKARPVDAAGARAGPRSLRLRWGVVVAAVALLAGSGLGFGLGSSVTPSGTAAEGSRGLGFLPERGWYVHQSGTEASPERPSFAIASNVPLHPADVSAIVHDKAGFPYSTLQDLPSHGVIIVASFAVRGVHQASDESYPVRKLPLRLRDAISESEWRGLTRRGSLGQYQLGGAVNNHNVDLQIYFGTSTPRPGLISAAQRQLDRLVVGSTVPSNRVHERALPLAPSEVFEEEADSRLIDRTFVCATEPRGGVYEVEARAHTGIRLDRSEWKQLPFAVVSTGGSTGANRTPALLGNSLVWITAGRPTHATTIDSEWRSAPALGSGTLAVNGACRSTNARVPLSSAGLQGGLASPFGDEFDCAAPRRVLVRLRAVLASPSSLRIRRPLFRTGVPAREAKLAVRSQTGKPLVYATVAESGKARLFTARGCFPD